MATSGGMPRILGYTRQGHPGEPIGGASAASLESMRGETLGTFLKTRRDKTVPESIGLDPGSAPRRVPGLRREELARLADRCIHIVDGIVRPEMPLPSDAETAASEVL